MTLAYSKSILYILYIYYIIIINIKVGKMAKFTFVYQIFYTSVVHASGIGQLQANPPVVSQRLSPGKPTQRG